MDRKLAKLLSKRINLISNELHKFISEDSAEIKYFNFVRDKIEISTFKKAELHAGMKNVQSSIPLYKDIGGIKSILLKNRIPSSNGNRIPSK